VASIGATLFMWFRREGFRNYTDVERKIAEMDKVLESSLREINKMGIAVVHEVEEKHKATLFLYELMEEKMNELKSEVWNKPALVHEALDEDVVSEMVAQYIKIHSGNLQDSSENHDLDAENIFDDIITNEVSIEEEISNNYKERPKFTNSKHKIIWELYNRGFGVLEIAKELNMGQGEVKLIMDLNNIA